MPAFGIMWEGRVCDDAEDPWIRVRLDFVLITAVRQGANIAMSHQSVLITVQKATTATSGWAKFRDAAEFALMGRFKRCNSGWQLMSYTDQQSQMVSLSWEQTDRINGVEILGRGWDWTLDSSQSQQTLWQWPRLLKVELYCTVMSPMQGK